MQYVYILWRIVASLKYISVIFVPDTLYHVKAALQVYPFFIILWWTFDHNKTVNNDATFSVLQPTVGIAQHLTRLFYVCACPSEVCHVSRMLRHWDLNRMTTV